MRFTSRTREEMEEIERQVLAPFAALSAGQNKTRIHAEVEHTYRTNFQRDRDRIIHSRTFRRLKHKRQVFQVTTGDHYRTRLTHTIEVVQLSRTLARTLGVNEDLTEAIALGHDLGHTPFGHIGEVVLNRVLKGKDDLDGLISKQDFGGFKHNYQSVRVVDLLEKKYEFEGLNLTVLVREGILKHTRLLREHIHYPDWQDEDLKMEIPCARSIEGQIVAICDEIAQRTHDLEDGIRAEFVHAEEVRRLPLVGLAERRAGFSEPQVKSDFFYANMMIKNLVDLLISDVVETTLNNIESSYKRRNVLYPFDETLVSFSGEIDPLQTELDHFITKRIIRRQGIEWSDELAIEMIRKLFMAYLKKPGEMRSYPTFEFFSRNVPQSAVDAHHSGGSGDETKIVRIIADYIAGMTDSFTHKEYERLVGTIKLPGS